MRMFNNMEKLRRITKYHPSLMENIRLTYNYRSLFLMLATRMMFSRYRETIFGWGWLLVRLILPVVLSNFVVSSVMNINPKEVPYSLFFMVGNSVWGLIVSSGRIAARSVRAQSRLIHNSAFPTVIIPISYQMSAFLEFLISMALIIALIAFYYFKTGVLYLNLKPTLLLSPLFLIGPIILGISLSLFTSLFNYVARDVRMLIPKLFQAWFFITPILYPLDKVPAKYSWIVHLNPLTFFIEAFRATFLGYGVIHPVALVFSFIASLVLFIMGFHFFSRNYRTVVAMA